MINADLSKFNLNEPSGFAEAVAYLLDLKKGKDVVIVDLSGRTIVADNFVIASAYSSTAVKALADYVEDELSKVGYEPLHRDVDQKWIALDYGTAIVHVFYKELRDFYQIERLWADGDNIKKFIE